MKNVKVEDVSFIYKSHDEKIETTALNNISIEVKEGSWISILGRNGSGKSTLAKLFNALLLPFEGLVHIYGYDTKDENFLWEIRKNVGMVFQNPDNQIIGTTVEEDVAFGPENLGVPTKELRKRVDETLNYVGLRGLEKKAPHMLSGGQKQRTAIAGILAMKPKIIVFDEATSMLDPKGTKEVLEIAKKLNKEENITIINITHNMEETIDSDKIVILDKGEIILEGKPKEVFSNVKRIKSCGLEVPQVTELLYELKKEGYSLPTDLLTVDEAYEFLKGVINENKV